MAPQCPFLQEAVGLVVENLWDTSGFESCFYHLLASGPWASCLMPHSLNLLICKMGRLSPCLIGLLRGIKRRSKHLAHIEHSLHKREQCSCGYQDCEDPGRITQQVLCKHYLPLSQLSLFPPLSFSCSGTCWRLDPLFTFAHADSPSVWPSFTLPHLDVLPDPDPGSRSRLEMPPLGSLLFLLPGTWVRRAL